MGKIKKILENELVGGTQGTDVYPVTSTKAVYDENNVRLDTILKPATEETAGLMSPEDKKNIDDKLSKSQGGEIKKPIVITNDDSNYSVTINSDSIYIWSKKAKKNILSVQIDKSRNTIDINSPDGNPINISNILNLVGKGRNYNSNIYSAYDDTFSASKFKLRNGNDSQVLLGDGSTTSKLVSYISASPQFDAYIVNILNIDGAHDSFTISGATKEIAGLMTAADKKALDNIPNTYLPLAGGTLTGVLRLNNINSDENGLDINNVNGIQSVDQDKVSTPKVWTTDGGSISLNKPYGIPTLNRKGVLNGYVSTVSGRIDTGYDEYNNKYYLIVGSDSSILSSAGMIIIERTDDVDGYLSSDAIITLDGKDGSIDAVSATFAGKVKSNGFVANNNGNSTTAWTTNGETIDLIDLLSNAAIYVAGGFELAESGIDNTTVIDSPDRIIYDGETERFLAKKGMTCYTHWKADISKNIAPPSRYGIETDNGVFPFNNQMYKFSVYDDIFIATCSDGKCTMKHLQ